MAVSASDRITPVRVPPGAAKTLARYLYAGFVAVTGDVTGGTSTLTLLLHPAGLASFWWPLGISIRDDAGSTWRISYTNGPAGQSHPSVGVTTTANRGNGRDLSPLVMMRPVTSNLDTSPIEIEAQSPNNTNGAAMQFAVHGYVVPWSDEEAVRQLMGAR